MSIIAGFMVPHPPMIVPAVGRGSEAEVEETTRAYERVAEEIAEIKPETIIISSPQGSFSGFKGEASFSASNKKAGRRLA